MIKPLLGFLLMVAFTSQGRSEEGGKLAVGNGLSKSWEGIENITLINKENIVLPTRIKTDLILSMAEPWEKLREHLPYAAIAPLLDKDNVNLKTYDILEKGVQWNTKLQVEAARLKNLDIEDASKGNPKLKENIEIDLVNQKLEGYDNIKESYKIYLACIYWTEMLEISLKSREKFKK